MLRVALHLRKALPGQFSIERVAENVRDGMPESVSAYLARLPHTSTTPARILSNIRHVRSIDADVHQVVGDAYYAALGLPRSKTLVAFQDLVGLRRSSGLRKSLFKALFYVLPAKRAGAIVAASEATRIDLGKLVPSVANRITVIPDPVDSRFVPAPVPRETHTVLQVGTRANKNLERVAEALKDTGLRLWIVGTLSVEQEQLLDRLEIPYRNFVGIDDATLVNLYRRASCVAFVSLFEGFGLPIVEGQSVGTPVLTSNWEPMTSVAGGAALLVDPEDTLGIRQGLLRLIEDTCLREQLIEAGFQNASAYRCTAVAARYVEVYERLLGVQIRGQRVQAA